MKKILFSLVAFSLAGIAAAQTQAPAIEWQKCLGGYYDDYANSVLQTSDGGYIVAGSTRSIDGDVSGNHGDFDGWVVKLDALGAVQWQKSLGGSSTEEFYAIQQTSDGGYIVAGSTHSNDGDVSGYYQQGYHGYNYGNGWIVKLDASGNLLWQKCLGGSGVDYASSIQQTSDGGYVVAGYVILGEVMARVVKLDATGNLLWGKEFGGGAGTAYHVSSIQQTSDGGYIVAGYMILFGPSYAAWVIKLDASGNLLWDKWVGGIGTYIIGYYKNQFAAIQQTSDGGYIVAGHTNDSNVSGYHGNSDGWVVKLDASGNLLWQKALGGSDNDFAYSIQQTSDGGYIVAGNTWSNNGDVSENHGGGDGWVVKLDALGNLLWQKYLGGKYSNSARSIQQTSDGGYIFAGETNSNDGDVSGNHGGYDAWIVKLASDNLSTEELSVNAKIGVYPNPVKDVLHFTSKEPVLKAEIFDLNGRLIKTAEVFNNQLSVSSLSKGVYYLNLQTGKGKLKTKFIKE